MRHPVRSSFVRVIRDAANASLDYYMPEPQASALFALGRITLVEINGTWEYFAPASLTARTSAPGLGLSHREANFDRRYAQWGA